MRLTGEEVRASFEQAATESRTGEPVSFDRVAELLNTRLADGLVGRAPLAGKHRRPEPVE